MNQWLAPVFSVLLENAIFRHHTGLNLARLQISN
jgi:hypothetical protein